MASGSFAWGGRIEQSPHRTQEHIGRERFLQECGAVRVHASVDANIIQIAGHEEHSQIRLDDGQMLREFPTVHARHDYVGEEKIHMTALLRRCQTGFYAVLGFNDLVADFDQLVPHKVAHAGFVFDE